MKKKSILILITIMMFIIMPFTVKAETKVICDYHKAGTERDFYYYLEFTIDIETHQLIGKPSITFKKIIKNEKETHNNTDVYSVEFSSDAEHNLLINQQCPDLIKVDNANKKIKDYTLPSNQYVFNYIKLYDHGKYYDGNTKKDLKEYWHYGTVFCDYIQQKNNINEYYQLQYKLKWKSDKNKAWYVINRIKHTKIDITTKEVTSLPDVNYDVTGFDSHALYNNYQSGDYTQCPNIITVDVSGKKITSSNPDIYRLQGKYFDGDSCIDYISEWTCENNSKFACVWNEPKYGSGPYCNVNNLMFVSCGDARDIPYRVPELTSFAVNLLKIAVPIILILVSLVSLIKALAAAKEDEIKKAQSILVKRIIIAVVIFFVISIVQFVINVVADNSEVGSIEACFKCFLNNSCGSSTYYKANVGATHEGVHNYSGSDLCIYFDGTEEECD